MKKIGLVAIIFAVHIVGCGAGDESHLKQEGPSDFVTEYTCQSSSPTYTRLIQQKKYDAAVQHVCQKFSLGCQNKKILVVDKPKKIANTNAMTNTIRVYRKGLQFQYCQTPHEGWLAAILGHEIVHTKQNKWERWKAAKTSWWSLKANAKLELEGWRYMWRMRDRFKLNSRMRIEIDSQIEEYKKELR